MTKRALILVTNKRYNALLRRHLKNRTFSVDCPPDWDAAKVLLAKKKYFIVFADLEFRKMPLKEVYHLVHKKSDETGFTVPVMGRGEIRQGIELVRRGAFDCILKPFGSEKIGLVIEKAMNLRSMRSEMAAMKREIETKTSPGADPSGSENNSGLNGGAFVEIPLEKFVEEKIGSFIRKVDLGKLKGFHPMVMERVEKPLLRLVLEKTNWNQIKASEILGINRNTLRKKINELRLSQSKIRVPKTKKTARH